MAARHALLAVRAAGTAPRLILQALFPQVMLAGGFGARDAGLIMMVHSVIAVVAILAFPRMKRRLSLSMLTLLGGLLSAGSVAAVAIDPSVPAMLAAFCGLGGIGWAVFSLRAPQEFVNNLPAGDWAANMSAVSRGPLIASLTVPPLALWLLHVADWRSLMLAVAAGIVLAALLSFPILRPHDGGQGAEEERAGPPRLPRAVSVAAAGMFLSGYIAGTFNTHLIILASSTGRGPTALALWSLGFGLVSLLAVSAWTAAFNAGRLAPAITGGIVLATVAAAATGNTPAGNLGLACAILWPVLSVGLYIESLREVGRYAGEETARLTGYFIILHMIAGSAGGYLTGWIADAFGSYAGAIFVLGGLGAALSLVRIAGHAINRRRKAA